MVDEKPILYLHIGATKTGSSALQKYFATHRSWLEENNVLYPTPDNHNKITGRQVDNNNGSNVQSLAIAMVTNTHSAEEVKSVAIRTRELASQAAKKVLFSSETFSSIASAKTIEFFFSAFKPHFDIKTIFFARDPLGWSWTWYQQAHKVPHKKGSMTVKEYIESVPNQCPQLPLWIKHSDSFHVFSYDEHRKDLLSPFLSVLDVTPPAGTPGSILPKYENRSLSDSEFFFLRLLNDSFDSISPDLYGPVFGALMTRPPTKSQVFSKPDPSLAGLAEARHEDFLKALEPYLPRERIVRSHSMDGYEPPALRLDPEDVRVGLQVIGRYYAKK